MERLASFASALVITVATVSVVGAIEVPAASAAPPGVTAPDKLYPGVNTTMDFSGTDPISGDNRAISVSGLVNGPGGCNTAAPMYSIANCPRIQMSLNTAQIGGEALLRIPGNTAITNVDADPDVDVIVAASGAVITEATDPNGGDSVLFNFNGTESQINQTLSNLQLITSPAFEESETIDASLLRLDFLAIQGNPAESTPWFVYFKVESQNLGPTLSVPLTPVDVAAGASNDITNQANVTDPEMCNLSICGAPFMNPGLHESDDEMLLVLWLADPANCGTFEIPVSSTFTSMGGPSLTSVHAVLTALSGEDLEDDQAAAIETSLSSAAALALDLSTQATIGNPTKVFAGVGDLSEIRDTLSDFNYNAPANEMFCALNVSVSDMGNNGTPQSFVGSPLGGNAEMPEPGYEVPDAKGQTLAIVFNVKDTHPDVTVAQTIPGPVPGVDPTSTLASFTITFAEPIDPTTFDVNDIDTTGTTAMGVSMTLIPVPPGLVYTLTATATGDGKIQVKVPAGAAYALNHNGDANYTNEESGTDDITWDQTKPKVTINQKVGQQDPTSTSPVVFTVVFDETVTTAPIGFTAADVDLSASTVGGSLVAVVTQPSVIDLKTYEVAVSGMTTSGNVIATVMANAILDQALNGSEASTSTDNVVAWDTTQPTVTVEKKAGQQDPTSVSPIEYTITFSEPVSGFAGGDVSLAGTTAGGTLVKTVTGGPTAFNLEITGMTTGGNVVAAVPAGVAQDALGNMNTMSTTSDNVVLWQEVLDTVDPTVTIDQKVGQSDPTSTSPIQFTVTFSEPVSGFTGADVSFAGTTAGGSLNAAVTGGPTIYNVDVSGMTTDGNVIASVPAMSATDAAANPNEASTFSDHTVAWVAVVDNVAPTVTINQHVAQADPTTQAQIEFTAVFSEPVSGFDGADVDLSGSVNAGAGLSALVTGGSAIYTVTVSGMSTPGNVVASIPASAAQDAAANPSAASTSVDNTVTWQADVVAPTVTVNQALGQADPTSASPVKFTVTFSEPVSGFDSLDVDLSASTATGALAAAVSGGPTIYTVDVAGMTGSGNVIASVPANAAQDAATNLSAASTSVDNSVAFVFDNVAPTVTVEQKASQADPTATSPIEFTVTFSEPVSGFVGADVDLTLSTAGGTLAATVTGGPAIYNVAVTGMTTNGDVIALVPVSAAQDAAANTNTASTSLDNSVIWNVVVPDVTPPSVTVEQKVGQPDPTSTAPIEFTVTFSEPVTGFTGADVNLANSTAGGSLVATVTAGPSIYNVQVSGMTTSGNVIAVLIAGVAQDAATNLNLASTSVDNTVAWQQVVDVTAPTVTINQAATQVDPTNGPGVQFTVVFSEPVAGFATGDVTVGGTAGATTAIVSGSGTTYTVDVSGMTQSGTVTASVAAGVATDAALNPNAASTSTDNTVQFNQPAGDVVAPTVTINQAAAQADPTATSPIVFSVAFSEPVAGFATGDVTLGGTAGATTATVSGSGSTYTVSVAGMTQSGTVIASIGAGVAADASNNPNVASTSTDNTVTFNTVVTISTPGGNVSISAAGGGLVSFTTSVPQVPPPPGWLFPYGQLSFTATAPVDGLVTFTLVLPMSVVTYFKLNGNVWQEFTWDGVTGAQINGNTLTITIRDNGRGDSNLTPGVVTDPGAPAIPAPVLPVTGTDGRTLLLFAAALMSTGIAFVVIRRRRCGGGESMRRTGGSGAH